MDSFPNGLCRFLPEYIWDFAKSQGIEVFCIENISSSAFRVLGAEPLGEGVVEDPASVALRRIGDPGTEAGMTNEGCGRAGAAARGRLPPPVVSQVVAGHQLDGSEFFVECHPDAVGNDFVRVAAGFLEQYHAAVLAVHFQFIVYPEVVGREDGIEEVVAVA